MSSKTAVVVKANLPNFAGTATLYRCSPPLECSEYDDEQAPVEYVIASAAVAMFSGPETYLFPATADGEVTGWGELPGSQRGTLSHGAVFADLGYEVVEP
jgi:hypothetical protein